VLHYNIMPTTDTSKPPYI